MLDVGVLIRFFVVVVLSWWQRPDMTKALMILRVPQSGPAEGTHMHQFAPEWRKPMVSEHAVEPVLPSVGRTRVCSNCLFAVCRAWLKAASLKNMMLSQTARRRSLSEIFPCLQNLRLSCWKAGL